MSTMVAIIHLIFPDSQLLQHKQSGQNLDGRHWNERSNAHDDGSRLFWILILFFCFYVHRFGVIFKQLGHFQYNSTPIYYQLYDLTPIYYQLTPSSDPMSSWLLSSKAAGASAEEQSFCAADRRHPTTACQQDAVPRDSRLLSSAAHRRMACVVMM